MNELGITESELRRIEFLEATAVLPPRQTMQLCAEIRRLRKYVKLIQQKSDGFEVPRAEQLLTECFRLTQRALGEVVPEGEVHE